jgi:hypothetical protein
MQAADSTLHPEIYELINSIWNREKFPQQWKESIIVAVCKKGIGNYCSNFIGISLLPTTYKMLFNILISRLTPEYRPRYWKSTVWIST